MRRSARSSECNHSVALTLGCLDPTGICTSGKYRADLFSHGGVAPLFSRFCVVGTICVGDPERKKTYKSSHGRKPNADLIHNLQCRANPYCALFLGVVHQGAPPSECSIFFESSGCAGSRGVFSQLAVLPWRPCLAAPRALCGPAGWSCMMPPLGGPAGWPRGVASLDGPVV